MAWQLPYYDMPSSRFTTKLGPPRGAQCPLGARHPEIDHAALRPIRWSGFPMSPYCYVRGELSRGRSFIEIRSNLVNNWARWTQPHDYAKQQFQQLVFHVLAQSEAAIASRGMNSTLPARRLLNPQEKVGAHPCIALTGSQCAVKSTSSHQQRVAHGDASKDDDDTLSYMGHCKIEVEMDYQKMDVLRDALHTTMFPVHGRDADAGVQYMHDWQRVQFWDCGQF